MTDEDFRDQVHFFWMHKGDPSGFIGWDEARCAQLMPAFYHAWKQCLIYEALATLAAKEGK